MKAALMALGSLLLGALCSWPIMLVLGAVVPNDRTALLFWFGAAAFAMIFSGFAYGRWFFVTITEATLGAGLFLVVVCGAVAHFGGAGDWSLVVAFVTIIPWIIGCWFALFVRAKIK